MKNGVGGWAKTPSHAGLDNFYVLRPADCEVGDAVLGHGLVIFILPLASAYAPASGGDHSPTALTALQAKADQAQPRDRCFLYAQLVRQMTELAGQQFNSGDSLHASETLKLVRRYAEKIHMGVVDDSRKLKNAELLMQRTSFRLKDILSEALYEDQPALEATLNQPNQVQEQLMTQVFKK
jgi:hypothetical protein